MVKFMVLIRIKLAIISLSWLCSACTHGPDWTSAAYAQEVQKWVGKDIRDLIAAHGYPDRTFKSPDGEEVYEYVSTKVYRTPESFFTHVPPYGGTATTHRMGGDIIHSSCKTWFEIHEQKITKVQFRGDLCRAPEVNTDK